MQRTVGVAPGTTTLLVQNNGLRGWMDPGGPVPASPPEPQVQFQTSPFTPPESTTPAIYLGINPPTRAACIAGSRLVPPTGSRPTGVPGVSTLQGVNVTNRGGKIAAIVLLILVTAGAGVAIGRAVR